MEPRLRREIDILQEAISSGKHKEKRAKYDARIFNSWRDKEISTAVALKYLLNNNGIRQGSISEEAFIWYAHHLGYRQYNPEETA